ncbi:MAG: hypothetical protein AAGC55_23805, partial [Myxococcota bacterium]
MSSTDDPRYNELLTALYLGKTPDWVSEAERSRLELASDGHRLAISQILGTSLPRASFYASAHLGIAFNDGVAECLVAQPA